MSPATAAAPPTPVTLVSGSDDLLITRAIAAVVGGVRAIDESVEVSDFQPGQFSADDALSLQTPSLFGNWRVVVVRAVHELPEDAGAALTGFAKSPMPEVAMVLVTNGRPSALVNALRKLPVSEVKAAPITQARKRVEFAVEEARRHGGRITEDAARALVEAVGSELGAIAGAVEQLMASTGPRGLIDDAAVAQHFRGRAETSGFTIADAVLAGEFEQGLALLRQALEVGTPPVFIPSALASGLREIVRVGAVSGARSQSPAELAKALQMPEWKLKRAQRLARSWPDDAVGKAFVAVAEADEGVKGGAVDAGYALERAVLKIVQAKQGRT
jgi:DNA polymerase-3 subunit delta